MYSITTQLKEISAAHRLVKNYRGKCNNLHGHNYKITVSLSTDTLDEDDFIVDFSVVKKLFDRWLLQHWQHATIVASNDKLVLDFLQREQQKYYLVPGDLNTTVECLSQHLFQIFQTLLHADAQVAPGVTLAAVTIYETHTASASYTLAHTTTTFGNPCGTS